MAGSMTGEPSQIQLTGILQQTQISKVTEQLRTACELIEAS